MMRTGINRNENKPLDAFEKDLKMLEYFQEEFKYRHTHSWNITIKLFLLTVVISVLPIVGGMFNISLDAGIKQSAIEICFPLIGVAVAIVNYSISRGEAERMINIDNVKYRINRTMESKYHYILPKSYQFPQKSFAYQIAKEVFGIELIIIAIAELIIIYKILS